MIKIVLIGILVAAVVFIVLKSKMVIAEPAGEIVPKTIPIIGFDPNGEPEINVQPDGSLHLMFNFMPPSFVEDPSDLGVFDDLDKPLSKAAGVNVSWEDREFFLISKPKPDTAVKIRAFLENYRNK